MAYSFGRYTVFICLLLGNLSLAQAPSTEPVTLRVGAVLSLTGTDAALGKAQDAALRAWQKGAQRRGLSVEVLTADDRSSPANAAAGAAQLIGSGVHALFCCGTSEALERLLPAVQEAGVLTLAPHAFERTTADYWLFSLVPDRQTQIRTVVLNEYARGSTDLALLGLEGPLGDVAAGVLRGSDVRLVAEERYAPDVRTLTPEALWVATRQPGAVLVWGHAADTNVAVDALSGRGYEGRVYINPEVYEDANVLERADLRGTLTVSDALSVEGSVSPGHPTYPETRRFISALSAVSGANRPTSAGGYAWDAMTLAERAFEELLAYNRLEPSNTAALRQALRDSFVGLGPVTGAAAVYDYHEGDSAGVQPESLVIAEVARGRLVAR